MEYVLNKTNITLTINSKGAEMVSVKYKGEERLWQNDNGTWERHAPILFPHAGKCSLIVDGVRYPDIFHGFARDMEFDLVSESRNHMEFVLKSNEESKKLYPFDFELYLYYEINDNEITIKQRFVNTGDVEMPFFVGCHESYALNNEVKNYFIEFEKEEDLVSIDDSMSGKVHDFGKGKKFSLDAKVLDNGGTAIFKNVKSSKVYLKTNDGALVAATTFEGYKNLLLWHSIGSKMICIEPWMNLPDSKEDDNKNLKDKENVIILKPSEEKVFERRIAYFGK